MPQPVDALATYVPRVLLAMDTAEPRAWERDATLVFADVSGFTRLTERLSEQGKIGAEQIVQAISRVWTALLTASADDGGDVLKFGGDALLLLYEGPDHPRRAVHAALAMQRALREVGRVETPRGAVRLRMSVGVHSGTQQFVVCGGAHLELFVVGEAATTTVETEAAAEAGQVLVSAATAGRLGLSADAPQLVRRLPAGGPGTTITAEPPRVASAHFVPASLRDRLERGIEEHEHRRATVGFVHVGGVDDLLAARGLAGLLGPLQHVTVGVQEVLARYGALLTCTDIGADGVKFMLSVGVPEASEDDPGRMLRTLHDIVELPIDPDLRIRAGTNTGNVFAGVVGAPTRQTWSTMGDATNLAARMMGKAPWGGVLATATTITESRSRFTCTPVVPMHVKGKLAPVHASLVGPPTIEPVRPDQVATALRGRDDQLATLRAGLEGIRNGGFGAAIELVGDVGSGRTRLLRELRSHADGLPWLETTCQPYDRASPYHVARVLLRRVLGISSTASRESAGTALTDVVRRAAPSLLPWLPLLGSVVDATVQPTPSTDEIDARYRQERTHQVVLELLDWVAGWPAVVVVEDLDHADEASLALLAHLAHAGVTTHPWLLVTTRRSTADGMAPDRAPDTLLQPLGPLDDEDAALLVTELAQQTPIPPRLQDLVVERGVGNPMFLIELALAAGRDTDELPPTIGSIVAARIDALDPEDRRALRWASVLGTTFTRSLRDRLLGPLGVRPERLDDARRLDGLLVTDGESCRFATELVREVAYERLPYRRRRELHGLAADALLTAGVDASWGAVPLHLARAERWSATWHAARTAAERAAASGAHATAADLWQLAVQAAGHLDLDAAEVAAVATAAGESWELAGAYERATASFGVARRLGDALVRARATARIALVHERRGSYTRARRWYGMALRELASTECDDGRSERVRVLIGDAGVRYRQGRLDACVRACLAALPEAMSCGDDALLAHAYYVLTGAYVELGDESTAATYRHLSLPVFERTGDLVKQGFVLNNMGVDAFFAGDLEHSIELYEQARDRLHRAGDVVGAAMSTNNVAESLMELGRDHEAEPMLRRALSTWRGARYPIGVALATRNLGVVARRAGDIDTAVALLREASEQFETIGAQAFVEETATLYAEALAEASELRMDVRHPVPAGVV